MKSLLISVFAMTTLSAHFALACNDEAIKTATSLVEQAQKKFETGLASSLDLKQAVAHRSELMLCQQPSNKDLCKTVVSDLQSAYDSSVKAYSAGMIAMDNVLSLHMRLAQAQRQCGQ